jgi:hypothetical protein
MKVVYTGLESSGKSLMLAMKAEDILHRNAKWFRKSGIARPIVSNIIFSDTFLDEAKAAHVPVHVWKNLDELIEWRDADVFIDELGTYFDSRTWSDLSLDVRRWIAQGAKSGIEMYAAAQDFAQVDVSFRRLTTLVFNIQKIIGSPRPTATRPPVKYIWGVCIKWELNARSFKQNEADMELAWMFPSFFFIRRIFCELFDTKQFLKRSDPPQLKHTERFCPTCGQTKIYHE